MSRLYALVLGACALVGLFISWAAASEAEDKVQKARSAFDMLYGEDLKRVAATRDPADDVALAARLLDAAKAAEAQPELMAVLCAKACDLGSVDPKGYDTALEAADLVSDKAPDLAAPCQDKIMDIRQRQYDVARGDEKVKAAEVLVDALLSSAAATSAAGDVDEASKRLHKALAVARAVKSSKADAVGFQIRTLAARQKAMAQAAQIKAQLEADPANAKAREALVRLVVVDLDNPAEAAKYLDETVDATLRKFVPAAAKPVEAAPELACLGLADWYMQLAATAGPAGKAAMYTRATAYAGRFLDLHDAADLDRTRMELAVKKALEELEKLGPQAKRKLRVVVVTGGSMEIDYTAFMKVFDTPTFDVTRSAQRIGGEIFENIDNWKYDAIVLYNARQKLTVKQQQNFLALLDKGVGLIVLHHGCIAYEDWPEYPRIIGTAYIAGTKLGVRYKVHVADPKHPITKGLRDYEFTDETFSGLRIDPQNHVLLATAEPSSSKAVGWTRPYKKAKVCYLQQGHDNTAYSNPVYKTLVRRAISWAGGQL